MPKMPPNMLGLLGEGYVLPRPPSRQGAYLEGGGNEERGRKGRGMEFRTKVKVSRINNVWPHKLHYSDLDMSRYCGFDVSNHQLGSRKFAAKSSVKSARSFARRTAASRRTQWPLRTSENHRPSLYKCYRRSQAKFTSIDFIEKRGPEPPCPPPASVCEQVDNVCTTYKLKLSPTYGTRPESSPPGVSARPAKTCWFLRLKINGQLSPEGEVIG